MGIDLVEMLGVSREALLGGALAGLSVAVLLAIVRARRDRRSARARLDLGRE